MTRATLARLTASRPAPDVAPGMDPVVKPGARRLRLAVSAMLLLVSALAMAAALALLVLRREVRVRDDADTRPCPACRSPAMLDGHSLVDDQGTRLLFASPEDAARYAADYARGRDAAR